MKVILLKELRGHGGEGDVIDVARGYANNYLLTQGYAILATKGNLKQLEQRKHNIAKREEVRIADANALAEKLNDVTITVPMQVGEEGQLFGSVTSPMIADAIQRDQEIEIDRRRIELNKPIKQTGVFPVDINIYRTIKATVNVEVVGVNADGERVEVAEAVEAAKAAGDAVADAVEEAVAEAVLEEVVEEVAAEVVAEEAAEQGQD